jgi:hypothetical protein
MGMLALGQRIEAYGACGSGRDPLKLDYQRCKLT